MASSPPPPAPLDDAIRAQLVAYLDGELNEDEESAVEVRLNADPSARREATALKQTWDLLDYLPKHEPSPSFTSKTLSKLDKVPAPPALAPTLTPAPAPTQPTRIVVPTWSAWRLAHAAVVMLALGVGYGAARLLTPTPAPPVSPRDADAELVADLRVVEQLRLYRYADDIELVQTLAKPELFGAE